MFGSPFRLRESQEPARSSVGSALHHRQHSRRKSPTFGRIHIFRRMVSSQDRRRRVEPACDPLYRIKVGRIARLLYFRSAHLATSPQLLPAAITGTPACTCHNDATSLSSSTTYLCNLIDCDNQPIATARYLPVAFSGRCSYFKKSTGNPSLFRSGFSAMSAVLPAGMPHDPSHRKRGNRMC
jgi:hypothetical protein